MMDRDAQICELEMPAQMQSAPWMQLRILSGCHQGASLAIESGQSLSVGCDDGCDVFLSDCGLAAGEWVLVSWQQKRWSALSLAENEAAVQEGAAEPPSHALGAFVLLGQVWATVCAEHISWQAFVPPSGLAPLEAQAAEESPAVDLSPPDSGAASAVEVEGAKVSAQWSPAVAAKPRKLRSTQLVLAGGLAAALLAGGWAVWRHAPAAAQADFSAELPAKPALSREAQEKAVKDASLAIALVDPALRMRVTPNADGGVTVSGWVDDVELLDRLAQGLSGLRPLPRLAVRTAVEVLDAFSDAGAKNGLNLQYSLLGAGKVQVKGVVVTEAMQQLVLAQLRERAPEGIEIVDGLRVAALQGPAVRQWLEAQGVTVRQADWDGEQLALGVDVSAEQRAQLERLLAAAQSPLTDVPFVLQTRTVKESVAGGKLAVNEAGLPFRIRSVVGGVAPYVVLADGVKLQPGGASSGWRLVAVAQDHLVFDGPRRVEVSR